MALYINTNVPSLQAQSYLTLNERGLSLSLQRLSSGRRINSAADDAAGLGISQKLQAAIASTGQASRNANDGISLIQVADGAMDQQAQILIRLRELATQAASGTLATTDRSFINTEAGQAIAEIDRIAQTTEFNNTFVLSTGTTVTTQVGIHGTSNDSIGITFSITDASHLSVRYGVGNQVDLSTATSAQASLNNIDAGINALSSARATVGAQQNRLTDTLSNLSTASVNLSAANSRILDTDVAEETAALTRFQILIQAGVAILAQANQIPQSAISLLSASGH